MDVADTLLRSQIIPEDERANENGGLPPLRRLTAMYALNQSDVEVEVFNVNPSPPPPPAANTFNVDSVAEPTDAEVKAMADEARAIMADMRREEERRAELSKPLTFSPPLQDTPENQRRRAAMEADPRWVNLEGRRKDRARSTEPSDLDERRDLLKQYGLLNPSSPPREAGTGEAKLTRLIASPPPPLEMGGGDWVTNKQAAKVEGVMVGTLNDYRILGVSSADKTFGEDKDGRVWRKPGTKNSHPWYLRSTLHSFPKEK